MRASAVKRGRNPRFPYVPIVIRDNGRTHQTNSIKAFATRAEAVAHAQAWIDHARAQWAIIEAHRNQRNATNG